MFPYFHDPAGTRWEPSADYADATARHTVAEHIWQHSMGDIVNALVNAGLRIDFLHELSHCCGRSSPSPSGTRTGPGSFPPDSRRSPDVLPQGDAGGTLRRRR